MSGPAKSKAESRPTRFQDGVTPCRSASGAGAPTKAPPLRFIDLFCGIGGFRIAFERAGAKCVFSSDWDRFSKQGYEANPDRDYRGDLRPLKRCLW